MDVKSKKLTVAICQTFLFALVAVWLLVSCENTTISVDHHLDEKEELTNKISLVNNELSLVIDKIKKEKASVPNKQNKINNINLSINNLVKSIGHSTSQAEQGKITENVNNLILEIKKLQKIYNVQPIDANYDALQDIDKQLSEVLRATKELEKLDRNLYFDALRINASSIGTLTTIILALITLFSTFAYYVIEARLKKEQSIGLKNTMKMFNLANANNLSDQGFHIYRGFSEEKEYLDELPLSTQEESNLQIDKYQNFSNLRMAIYLTIESLKIREQARIEDTKENINYKISALANLAYYYTELIVEGSKVSINLVNGYTKEKALETASLAESLINENTINKPFIEDCMESVLHTQVYLNTEYYYDNHQEVVDYLDRILSSPHVKNNRLLSKVRKEKWFAIISQLKNKEPLIYIK